MGVAAFIERYQELIVGAIGFGGVILTLRGSARASRDQHDHALATQALGLRRALAEELRWAHEGLLRVIQQFEESERDKSNVLVPELNRHPIFSASIPSLPLLNASEIRAVSRAYAALEEASIKMGFFGEYEERTPKLRYVRVPPKNAAEATKVYRNHAKVIAEAVEILDEQLKGTTKA